MTSYRAPSPVRAEAAGGDAHGSLLTAAGPQGPHHAVSLIPASPQVAATLALEAHPGAVRSGREFAQATLRDWGMAALTDAAELVISELVTNALRHGCPQARRFLGECPIRLRLLAQVPFVMCMVTDPGGGIPVLRDAHPAAESGRGLTVVEACCVRWGWHLLDEGGKVVWALLRP